VYVWVKAASSVRKFALARFVCPAIFFADAGFRVMMDGRYLGKFLPQRSGSDQNKESARVFSAARRSGICSDPRDGAGVSGWVLKSVRSYYKGEIAEAFSYIAGWSGR